MSAAKLPLGPRFARGELVRVIDLAKPGHVRTPDYILGKVGRVTQLCGLFLNPEDLSVGITQGPVVALYRVEFLMSEVWGESRRNPDDSLSIELYDHWLEKVKE